MAADQAAERVDELLGGGAARTAADAGLAAARTSSTWAVEYVPVSTGFRDDPDARPSLVMVMADGYIVSGDVQARRPHSAKERAAMLAAGISAAARAAGVLPERVLVRDAGTASALQAELSGRGIRVEAGLPPEVDEALDGSLEHLCGSAVHARAVMPGVWAETEASHGELQALHEAAAEFYRAAPWESIEDSRPLLLEFADDARWAASVMGGGGIETGLAIYSDADDLYTMLDSGGDMEAAFLAQTGTSLSVTFQPRPELDRAMQREVAKAGWPVAGPGAYPRMIAVHPPERRATPEHVRRITAALRAIAVVSTGGDPQMECGVKVSLVAYAGDVAWPAPGAATPCMPAGPGADPAAGYWDAVPPAEVARMEAERLARLATWLNRQKKPTKALRAATLRNGEHWAEFLVGRGMPAGAVTEYELRLFVFGVYPRSGTTKAASQVLPNSLRLLFRFLEKEGIEYPFGERVIADLETVLRDRTEPGDTVLDVLDDIAPELFLDLDLRALVPSRELAGVPHGWPTLMNHTVVRLQRELHRRWLEWRDEEIARGLTDLEELHDVLVARQREWETTRRADLDGGTPAEAVDAWNREQAKQPARAEPGR